MKNTNKKNFLTKKDVSSGNLKVLSSDEQNYVMSLKNKLDMSYESTLTFGQEARRNLSNFSNTMLQEAKSKDSPELDNLLTELLVNIDKVNATTLTNRKANFFERWFQIDRTKNFISQYDSVAEVLDDIKRRMHITELDLRKDINRCAEFEEQNIAYIKELDYHIMALTLKLDECKPILEDKKALANTEPDDILLSNEVAVYKKQMSQMERKHLSLLQIREIAAQNVIKIRIIRDAEAVMVEQIQTSINDVIPLWESELVVAIELTNLNSSIETKKAIKQMTEKLTEANSAFIKSSAIEVAKQIESGVMDTEILKKNNQTLIDMVKEIKNVKEKAKVERNEQIKELLEMQKALNQVTIDTLK